MRTPIVDPNASVSNAAILGQACRVEAHAVVGPGCILEADAQVDVRATVVCTQSDYPNGPATIVKVGAIVGAGALVYGPLTIGQGAVVKPGAVVTTDVPAHAIVAGNPAGVIGYTQTDARLDIPFVPSPKNAGDSVSVSGATLTRLPRVVDVRGSLTFAEVGRGLPFDARRIFIVFDVTNRNVRGSHAHRELHEFLIAIGGQVIVALDDGHERSQVQLDEADLALHIPPMVWSTQYNYSRVATLVVLASAEYDDKDYIRDYDDYLRLL